MEFLKLFIYFVEYALSTDSNEKLNLTFMVPVLLGVNILITVPPCD